MRRTLVVTKKQENELEQILNELIFALRKTFSEEDLIKLSVKIFADSGKQTFNSKKQTATKVFKTLGNFSGKTYLSIKQKIELYRTNGFNEEFNKDLLKTKTGISNSPVSLKKFGLNIKDKAVSINENFIQKTKEEKIELISVGILATLIFFASAGGEDLEGGIPDSDLNVGIGFHRHFLSHSIITGFIVEFVMRSGIEILNTSYTNLPAQHHKFWDFSNNYINKHKGVAIGAMWAGISAHLLKDSGIFGHEVKPYNGIPVELSMDAHKNLFVANGTASAMFAFDKTKK